MAESTGQITLRKENISKVVTGFALQEYVMKQVCTIESSSSWKETYFKETAADLAGHANDAIDGVPRLANFPYGEVEWTETSTRNLKHGFEGVISWEDEATSNIAVIARTLLRIARAVTKSVDTEIYDQLVANAGNTVTIAALSEWNAVAIANRDPIQNILDAMMEISIDNYNPRQNGYLILNPTDFSNLMGNASVRNAGQFFTDDVTKNGKIGRFVGLTILVSNTVAASGALVVVGKEACTWKSVKPLTVETITEPGISKTIRAWEVGSIQVTNPDAVCKIVNTEA